MGKIINVRPCYCCGKLTKPRKWGLCKKCLRMTERYSKKIAAEINETATENRNFFDPSIA